MTHSEDIPTNVRQGLDHLSRSEVVTIVTRTKDGRDIPTLIGAVVVDGVAYVRSQNGDRGKWYHRALRTGTVSFVDGARQFPATVELVTDPAEIRRGEAATYQKYGGPLRNVFLKMLLLRTRRYVLRATLLD
ncbi:DUF2255 family protein [Micromonospora sp. NPDC050397]|uniref:DUF2255 family protein n=1 Tax=Micromonospora sp. NPDC050397 TaxID=3364279 RepID=UPI00384C55F1